MQQKASASFYPSDSSLASRGSSLSSQHAGWSSSSSLSAEAVVHVTFARSFFLPHRAGGGTYVRAMSDAGGDVGGGTHHQSSALACAAARFLRNVSITSGSGASYLYEAEAKVAEEAEAEAKVAEEAEAEAKRLVAASSATRAATARSVSVFVPVGKAKSSAQVWDAQKGRIMPGEAATSLE